MTLQDPSAFLFQKGFGRIALIGKLSFASADVKQESTLCPSIPHTLHRNAWSDGGRFAESLEEIADVTRLFNGAGMTIGSFCSFDVSTFSRY